MNQNYINFLEEISPYVIVVGSFAKGTQRPESDIDLYIKRRPEKELEERWEEELDEYYMPEIIDIANKYDFHFTSVIIGHIAIERTNNIPRMIELSYHYNISKNEPIKKIEIEGIKFKAAIDNKDLNFEETIDYIEY